MTPEEWNQYWRECWLTPHDLELLMQGRTVQVAVVHPGGITKWLRSEAEPLVDHPSVAHYFDHLYAQELGIQWP